ncbi:hypothetical protein AAVH_40057 [Aphelenchoides avenae]|nr:hypothetical protein AAVH_40057 [Aphelenchus avenae]
MHYWVDFHDHEGLFLKSFIVLSILCCICLCFGQCFFFWLGRRQAESKYRRGRGEYRRPIRTEV